MASTIVGVGVEVGVGDGVAVGVTVGIFIGFINHFIGTRVGITIIGLGGMEGLIGLINVKASICCGWERNNIPKIIPVIK